VNVLADSQTDGSGHLYGYWGDGLHQAAQVVAMIVDRTTA